MKNLEYLAIHPTTEVRGLSCRVYRKRSEQSISNILIGTIPEENYQYFKMKLFDGDFKIKSFSIKKLIKLVNKFNKKK